MPGTNAGTGYPIAPRCVRGHGHELYDGKLGQPVATGRSRPLRARERPWIGYRGRREENRVYEYRCARCGHVGWSKHPGLARGRR